ncbi:MAG: WbqC family protein [Bacteroidota bacterium]
MPLLLSTSYLPPISYISACSKAEMITIELFETYQKQTFRNHCLIAGPNGAQQLTIPVIKVNGNHTKTKDIIIDGSADWQKIHWKSIETAYNNSPFFLYYRDYFEPYFFRRFESLVEFNNALLNEIFIILRMNIEIEFTEDYQSGQGIFLDRGEELVGKRKPIPLHFRKYTQVFENKYGFLPDLSIIDLIFNLGPEARDYFS